MKKTISDAIPCYNEAVTIAKVVADFKTALPKADITVFDNHSTDNSGIIASKAGASVHHVRKKGKGQVMRAIFDTISTELIIVVDGDDTYYAQDASLLVEAMLQQKTREQ